MRARIRFEAILQDCQHYTTFELNEARVVSVVRFSMDLDGHIHGGLSVEVRQPYGTEYATEPLEVGPVLGGYDGPWNQSGFAELCEKYYRRLAGSTGAAMSLKGAPKTRVRGNVIAVKHLADLDLPDPNDAAS